MSWDKRGMYFSPIASFALMTRARSRCSSSSCFFSRGLMLWFASRAWRSVICDWILCGFWRESRSLRCCVMAALPCGRVGMLVLVSG